MPASDAQKRASQKWEKEKVDQFILRLPKGKKELLQICAEINGESANAMINRLIDEEIDKLFESPSNNDLLHNLIESKFSTITDPLKLKNIEETLSDKKFLPIRKS